MGNRRGLSRVVRTTETSGVSWLTEVTEFAVIAAGSSLVPQATTVTPVGRQAIAARNRPNTSPSPWLWSPVV